MHAIVVLKVLVQAIAGTVVLVQAIVAPVFAAQLRPGLDYDACHCICSSPFMHQVA